MRFAYFFYIYLFALAAAFALKRTGKEKPLLIDMDLSNEIKGIGIFLVIAGHISRNCGIKNMFINSLGAQGVVLFLFISGYGLTKSYKKKGITRDYIKNRFKTMMLPFILVTALWILINTLLLGKTYSIGFILTSLLGIEHNKEIDTTMWYIEFIIIWYIVYGGVFKLKLPNIVKLLSLVIVSLVFYSLEYSHPFSNLKYQMHVHAFIFPIGVFWGLYDVHIIEFFKKHNILYKTAALLIITFLAVTMATYSKIGSKDYLYIIYNFSFGAFLILILNVLNFIEYKSSFLISAGILSYNLYLFEGIFREAYSIFRYLPQYASIHVYMLIVIILSIILKIFLESISLKVKVTR